MKCLNSIFEKNFCINCEAMITLLSFLFDLFLTRISCRPKLEVHLIYDRVTIIVCQIRE